MPVIKETVTMTGTDGNVVAQGIIQKLKAVFENNGFTVEVTNSTLNSYIFNVILSDNDKLEFYINNGNELRFEANGSSSKRITFVSGTGTTSAEINIEIVKYKNDIDIYMSGSTLNGSSTSTVTKFLAYRAKEVTFTDGTTDILYFPYANSNWISHKKSINVTLQNLTTRKPYEDTKIIYSKCGILYSSMLYGFFNNVYDCQTTYSMVEGEYTVDGVSYYHKDGYLYRI